MSEKYRDALVSLPLLALREVRRVLLLGLVDAGRDALGVRRQGRVRGLRRGRGERDGGDENGDESGAHCVTVRRRVRRRAKDSDRGALRDEAKQGDGAVGGGPTYGYICAIGEQTPGGVMAARTK